MEYNEVIDEEPYDELDGSIIDEWDLADEYHELEMLELI